VSGVPQETVSTLRELGVSTVYEASGRHGLVDADYHQLVAGSRAAGPARIARCGQNDNRAVHEVMDRLQPGEVLVLTMPEPAPVALVGELLLTQAAARGAAAVLVDAAARDIEVLREFEVPVWTRWIRARGATKAERGELDVAVEVGGTRICPGDLVVLDADGVVVVRPDDAETVLEASRARFSKEEAMRTRLRAGELSYDIHGLRREDTKAS
jgi:4-hydroxy-4-methyl-2-oxoglutarate aldolase